MRAPEPKLDSMKKSVFILGFWLAAMGWSPAQVTVEVVFDQDQFLRNESMLTKVRVSNSSGQTLRLGDEPNWLSFEIQDATGRDVRQVGPVPLADPFDLESSKVAKLTIDLMPYFELGKMGRYTLTVSLTVKQLHQTFVSRAKTFDIMSGTTLWEREFGVPSTGVPEVRKYALQQANFLKELRLYLRVTDQSDSKLFRLLSLGPLLSFTKPETQLDKASNLHVLFQTGARDFRYLVVNPDGEILTRQTHEYMGGSRPLLKNDEESGLRVSGGRRRVLLSDIPPPPEETLSPPVPEPPPTNAPPTTPKKKK
jgi:hypothetical protein